jgi:hypothetical protein
MKVTKAKGLNTIWLADVAATSEQHRFNAPHQLSRMHRIRGQRVHVVN